jgi:hypothetical protein
MMIVYYRFSAVFVNYRIEVVIIRNEAPQSDRVLML